MTDYQCTLLAGIPNAPSVYDLNENPDLASERQRQVVGLMVKYAGLSRDKADLLLCGANRVKFLIRARFSPDFMVK